MNNKTYVNTIILMMLLIASPCAMSGEVAVTGLQVTQGIFSSKIIFDLSGPTDVGVNVLSGPHRVVVDMRGVRLSTVVGLNNADIGVVKGLRYAMQPDGIMRFVLDLEQFVRPYIYTVGPESGYGHKLVIELRRIDDSDCSV